MIDRPKAVGVWVLHSGASVPVEVPGTQGAAVPTWSGNSDSVLYAADGGLLLLASFSARPAEIAAPLFPIRDWPNYYGQVNGQREFAWWSP
jgi:hypothetical protein